MLAASPDLINSIEINAKAFMTLSKIAFRVSSALPP